MNMKYLCVSSVALATALTVSGQSFAAETVATAGDREGYVEELVVTARKREERLQDIPLSVSVVTAQSIADRGVRDLSGVGQFTPGLSFEKANRYGAQGGNSRPVIRGMANIQGESNASVFVDGILFSDSILSFPFDLVERVEVIKGPQAALYGRSTFSGAINLITKKGTNNKETTVTARLAQYGDREISVLTRGPIIEDQLFYMLQGRYYEFGGQYKNTLDGQTVGQEKSYNLNGSLEWRPTDNFRAVISGGYIKDEDGHPAIAVQDRFSNNCYLNTPRQYYCGEVKQIDNVTLDLAGLGLVGLRRESYRLAAALTYDVAGFTITSNTGVFSTKTEFGHDSTYQGATAFGATTIPGAPGAVRPATDAVRTGNVLRNEVGERDEWSTELRVQSPTYSNGVNFMVGGFYYQRRRPLEERHFSLSAPTIDSGTDRIDNVAVFAALNADVTDKLSVSAEVRYAEDTIGNYKRTGDILIERSFRSTTPRFTANYDLNENSMVFATLSKGNKPGVINSDPRFPPDVQFADEEYSWNYEIGMKNRLFGGRVLLNAAAFYVDWRKQQLTSAYFFPTGGSRSYIINAGQTEIKGFEVELQATLNEYVNAGFTYALNDAKFVQFNDSEARDLFGNPSVAGKQVPNTSKNQASAFVEYRRPMTADYELVLRADGSYNQSKFDQIYNLAETGDQYLLNLRAGVQGPTWKITAFVDNVTDDRTPSTIIRWIDQLNTNVPQYTNANPAQNNWVSPTGVVSTTTERAFQVPLAAKRKVGVVFTYRF